MPPRVEKFLKYRSDGECRPLYSAQYIIKIFEKGLFYHYPKESEEYEKRIEFIEFLFLCLNKEIRRVQNYTRHKEKRERQIRRKRRGKESETPPPSE
jgi:hypothetical protein